MLTTYAVAIDLKEEGMIVIYSKLLPSKQRHLLGQSLLASLYGGSQTGRGVITRAAHDHHNFSLLRPFAEKKKTGK